MTHKVRIVGALMGLAFAQPSYACMDLAGPTFRLDKPPVSVPSDLTLLRLKLPIRSPSGTASSGNIELIPATVATGGRLRVGERVLIEAPANFDSCTFWAQSETSRYLVGRLYRTGGQLRMTPKAYVVRTK